MHGATDVDEVIGDNAEADPAVHSDLVPLEAAVECSNLAGRASNINHLTESSGADTER